MLKYAELSFVVNVQHPTQSCRSLPSQYSSTDLSGFFKNLEIWERIVYELNKRYCYQDRRSEKGLPPRATSQ